MVWFSSRVRVWSTSLDWLPPMRIFAGVCLAALVLAACDRTSAKTDTSADATGEVPIEKTTGPVPPGVEAAPSVKGGLWEITSRTPGMEGKVRTCFDPALQGESAVVAQGMNRRNCSRSDWKKIDGGYSFEVACERRGRMFVSSGTLTGDLTTTYAIQADAVMSADGVTQGAKQNIEAHNIGACPVDLRPGEAMVLVDGQWRRPPAAPIAG